MVPSLSHDDTFILLRWILLFHNTSFVLIAIEWTMLLHRASLKSKVDKKKLRMILFIIFGIVVGFIYVHTIVLFGVIDGKREVRTTLTNTLPHPIHLPRALSGQHPLRSEHKSVYLPESDHRHSIHRLPREISTYLLYISYARHYD